MDLRPYQLELVSDLRAAMRKHRRVLAVLPTGGGKTVVFSHVAASVLERGYSVWIGVHRTELLAQTCEKLRAFSIPHGIIAAGLPITPEPVQVFMVQTLRRRLDKLITRMPDLLITDECHHAPSDTYRAILSQLPADSHSLGFTATPCRLDGRGLGEDYDALVEGAPIAQLIDDGYLVPARTFIPPSKIDVTGVKKTAGDYNLSQLEEATDRPVITGDVIEHYKRHALGTAAVAFCVTVKHAEHVAEQFNAAGISATSIDGSLAAAVRQQRLDDFRAGRVQVLTSCNLISEGFDLPRIETAILLRKTMSESLYLQQVGRALRIDPERGKTHALILDHVGNALVHGLVTDRRTWSLDGRKKRSKRADEESAPPLQVCDDCFMAYVGDQCPHCGTPSKKERKELPTQVDGELIEIVAPPPLTPKRIRLTPDIHKQLKEVKTRKELFELALRLNMPFAQLRDSWIAATADLPGLLRIARVMEYHPGWATLRYRMRKTTG